MLKFFTASQDRLRRQDKHKKDENHEEFILSKRISHTLAEGPNFVQGIAICARFLAIPFLLSPIAAGAFQSIELEPGW